MQDKFREVAKLHELGDDEPLGLEVSGLHIALYRLGDQVFATENVCPHQFALLSDGYLEDGIIECPLHQARFDVRTGAMQCGPADRALRVFAVRVDSDTVYVNVEQT